MRNVSVSSAATQRLQPSRQLMFASSSRHGRPTNCARSSSPSAPTDCVRPSCCLQRPACVEVRCSAFVGAISISMGESWRCRTHTHDGGHRAGDRPAEDVAQSSPDFPSTKERLRCSGSIVAGRTRSACRSARRGTARSTTCSPTNWVSPFIPMRSHEPSAVMSSRPTCRRFGFTTSATRTRPSLKAGAHPKVVSERLGHATIGVTLDLYSTRHALDRTRRRRRRRVTHPRTRTVDRSVARDVDDRAVRSRDVLRRKPRRTRDRHHAARSIDSHRSSCFRGERSAHRRAQEKSGHASSRSSSWRRMTTRRPKRRAGISPRRTDSYAVVREIPRTAAASSTVRVARSGGSWKVLMSAPS